MLSKLTLSAALLGIAGLMSFAGTSGSEQSAASCECCGAACQCSVCECDAIDCDCHAGGNRSCCSPACCTTCCQR